MGHTQGLVAAPFVPLSESGEINLTGIEAYAQWLIRNEVTGVFVNGTTGEGLSLTMAERNQIVDAWLKNAGGSLKVFVHVSHTSVEASKALAEHAAGTNCFAIALLPPLYFKPANVKELVNYCREVAGSAPDTPFYYYHMPAMTGVHFSMIDFMELATQEIPSFRGMKYTFEDLCDFGLCLFHEEKKYDILFGRDEMLLAGLAIGTRGAVGSFYNFLGAYANRLLEDYNRNEMQAAQEKQQFLREFTRVLKKNGGSIASLKSVMRISGIDCGPARPPLQNLTAKEEYQLEQDLESIGFFKNILH